MPMHSLKEIFYDILDAASATPGISMQQDIKALLPINGNGANKNVVIINNQNVSINNVTSLAVKGLRELEAQTETALQVYDSAPLPLPQGSDPMEAIAEYCYTNRLSWKEAQDSLKKAYLSYATNKLGKTADVATRLKISVPQITVLKRKYKLTRET